MNLALPVVKYRMELKLFQLILDIFRILGDFVIKLRKYFLWVLVFWALYVNFSKTEGMINSELTFVKNNRDWNYDEKMRYKWGKYYDYMVFVRDNTPADAVIAIPPQMDPWQRPGNGALDYYFLYPRVTSNSSLDKIADDPFLTHVLVVRGDHTEEDWSRWPKFDIPTKKIIYPESPYLSRNWAIIVLEKEKL